MLRNTFVDKLKLKNWLVGDTFTYEIESEKYAEYNGRYLIFNLIDSSEMLTTKYQKMFRVKITKNNKLPKTLEELNNLEYIIVIPNSIKIINYCHNAKKMQFIPDEYGFVYDYRIIIYFNGKNDLSKFEYLGNYSLQELDNEYKDNDGFPGIQSCTYKFFQNIILDKYEWYNLKKGNDYIDEGNYRAHNSYFEILKVFDDVKRRSDEYFKEHPINPENNRKKIEIL